MMKKLFPLFLAGFFGCAARENESRLFNQFMECAEENWEDKRMDRRTEDYVFSAYALIDYIPVSVLLYTPGLNDPVRKIEIIGELSSSRTLFIDDKNLNGKIEKKEKAFYYDESGKKKRLTTPYYRETMRKIMDYWNREQQNPRQMNEELLKNWMIIEGRR